NELKVGFKDDYDDDVAAVEARRPKTMRVKKTVMMVKDEDDDDVIESIMNGKNLLDLREGVRKHMQYKIGNGYNTSMCHDSWSTLPTLDTIISRREIYAAGFSNDASVADCIDNERWKWPDQWLVDHPILCWVFS
ncbi:hypothetical protein Tco_1515804, partial [Tanacetum coccineum]